MFGVQCPLCYLLPVPCSLLAYSAFVERTALGLTRLELGFSRLPKSFDGFTVLQISDLHIAHWGILERRMEKLVSGLDVDLLVLTGDIAVSSRGARLFRDFLGRVRPGRETLAVFGNTEHKGEYGRRRRADLAWDGLRVLTNEHIVIEREGEHPKPCGESFPAQFVGGRIPPTASADSQPATRNSQLDGIVVVGVDDPFTEHDDLDQALAGAPEDAFKLLLAHAPSIAGDAARAGIDLVLSGHTHGGQIRFPYVGAIYSHLHKHKRLIQGLFEGPELARIIGTDPGEMRVYTSRGVGISNLPMRFLCPPEIVYVTLRSLD